MPLAEALLLMGSVWAVLLLGGVCSALLGGGAATLGAYALATLLVATAAGPGPPARRATASFGAGVLVGLASWPAWLVVLRGVFDGIGLDVYVPTSPAGTARWVAAITLAPVFEELLYREHLLEALRSRIGTPPAVVVTSVLFSLPHLAQPAVVATLLVGLVLGGARVALGSVAPCVGVHAGLNLAAWLSAAPPCRPPG